MTVFRNDVWAHIERHVFSSPEREVGGILVGRLTDGEAVIEEVLPALAATSGSANVTFTHDVWETVHAALDRDFPEQRIVGWYHSHPRFGVFMSEYDVFAHKSFFSAPALVAVVVDPHAGEAGWFALRDDLVEQVGSRRTDREPLGSLSATTAAAAGKASSRQVVRAVGLALAATVMGFLAGAAFAGGDAVERPRDSAAPSTAVQAAGELPSPVPTQPGRSRQLQLTYRVQRGDSFWSIARAFYGDGHHWTEIRDANPRHSGDGLEVGEQLRVPLARATISDSKN